MPTATHIFTHSYFHHSPLSPLPGEGRRPKCHFDLSPSDYLSADRRTPDRPLPAGAPSPMDKQMPVIEFKSLGCKVRNTKRFSVLNPTASSYSFQWVCLDKPGTVSPFVCATPTGLLLSGRKAEMVFEYTPTVSQRQSYTILLLHHSYCHCHS